MKEAIIRRYDITARNPQAIITLDDAKAYLRVDGTTEDALITELLNAVVADAERSLNYALTTMTITEHLHITCSGQELLALAWGPVDQVASVSYEGDLIDPADYSTLLGQTGVLMMDGGWETGHYTIEYSTAPALVKPNVRLAIMKLLAQYYDNRHDPAQTKPTAADYLLLKEEQNVFRS